MQDFHRSVCVAAVFLLSLVVSCYAQVDDSGSAKSFTSLSEYDLKTVWSTDDGSTLQEKMQQLHEFEAMTMVDVKLVGFDGDGKLDIGVSPNVLLKHLEALGSRRRAYAVEPLGTDLHELSITHRVIYRVTHTNPSLAAQINSVVDDKAVVEGETHLEVDDVDRLIRADYRSSPVSYAIYIINPKPSAPVSYWYKEDTPTLAHNLGTNLWVATNGRDDRYIWIDLTAARPSYGPHTSGWGVVVPTTLPTVSTLVTQGFLAQVAALVSRTTQLLVLPPVRFFPLPHSDKVTVMLITMYNGRKPRMPRWSELKQQLKDFAVGTQQVIVKEHAVSFASCELCAAAFSHALRSHTSTFGDGGSSMVHQYLDATELRHWLTRFDDAFWGIQGGWKWRMVPVFVFSTDSPELLLLDRKHQAMPFNDMVIAVQSHARVGIRDHVWNGVEMRYDPKDPSRAIMAATLSTAWGVTPITDVWNAMHESVEKDYLFSITASPFGPFSDSMTPNWVQADAAARAAVYSHIHSTLSEVAQLLGHFAGFRLEIQDVLSAPQHLDFIRRWNFIRHKLDRSSNYLSLHNFPRSFEYIKAVEEDVTALHSLVHAAGSNLLPSRDCSATAQRRAASSSSFSSSEAAAAAVLAPGLVDDGTAGAGATWILFGVGGCIAAILIFFFCVDDVGRKAYRATPRLFRSKGWKD